MNSIKIKHRFPGFLKRGVQIKVDGPRSAGDSSEIDVDSLDSFPKPRNLERYKAVDEDNRLGIVLPEAGRNRSYGFGEVGPSS